MADEPAEKKTQAEQAKFPDINTLNRRATERKDVNEKQRYFAKLLVKLDGEIGEQRQTFNELMQAGELVDPEGPQLHIERLEMLRDHAARLLQQLSSETGNQSVFEEASNRPSRGTLMSGEETAKHESSDRLMSVKEVATLLDKSISWVYKRSMLNEIPRHKIGGHLRFRKSEIEAWIDEHAGETL